MPRAKTAAHWTDLTLDERRERRRLRREKQREDNVDRAAKMQAARLRMEKDSPKSSIHIGCPGRNGSLYRTAACRPPNRRELQLEPL
jgi:hypothetical protein